MLKEALSAGLQQLRWFYKVWHSSEVADSLPFDISAHLRKSWEILRRYAADPGNFFRLASSALESSDFEIVDAEPVELGFLQVYPQVEGVQRHPRGFAVRLGVREAVQ